MSMCCFFPTGEVRNMASVVEVLFICMNELYGIVKPSSH